MILMNKLVFSYMERGADSLKESHIHEFQVRIRSPKTQYLFGIDENSAYTINHVNQRDLRGDMHVRRQVRLLINLSASALVSKFHHITMIT